MKKHFKLLVLFCCLAATLIFPVISNSQTGTKSVAQTGQPVREIMPGMLQGYLSKAELPNSFKLIPPPPEKGSAAYTLDQDYARKALESRSDTARMLQATADAEFHFPAAARVFESTLGIEISEAKTPKLYMLMRRVSTDALLSTYAAKDYYKRPRPFVINQTPLCTPQEEEALRKDGSYPSGHTAIGWAWALMLCEIFPAKSESIFLRGYAFGESRVYCNAQWHSDVETGRILGAATMARLHANPAFIKDLAAAKEEAAKTTTKQK